jgi:c-di-GMP-binding flagellar brake protein YcgR
MGKWDRLREHIRAKTDLPVRVETVDGDLQARVIDISEQGLRYVRSNNSGPHEDREVLLDFSLPGDDQEIRVLASVAGISEEDQQREVSVTFFALPEPDAKRIRRFVGQVTSSTS